MHGNLEPEEHVWSSSEHVNDLYEDMERLNALYEELMWNHEDVLDFVADYENDQIVIRNRTRHETN